MFYAGKRIMICTAKIELVLLSPKRKLRYLCLLLTFGLNKQSFKIYVLERVFCYLFGEGEKKKSQKTLFVSKEGSYILKDLLFKLQWFNRNIRFTSSFLLET